MWRVCQVCVQRTEPAYVESAGVCGEDRACVCGEYTQRVCRGPCLHV